MSQSRVDLPRWGGWKWLGRLTNLSLETQHNLQPLALAQRIGFCEKPLAEAGRGTLSLARSLEVHAVLGANTAHGTWWAPRNGIPHYY